MTIKSDYSEVDAAPVISFIVPAYNEETELPGTLTSIRTAADAAACEYEIVLVDDGSTDSTAAIARQFGVQLVPIWRRHIAAARNAGALNARGDVFVFVDADTRIGPQHVRGVLQALQAGAAGGGALMAFDREIPHWGTIFFRAFTSVYFERLKLGAGAFLFTTRENFLAVGGFDETYFASEEVFFSLALKKLGPFKILTEPAITSGRKLRLYSCQRILITIIRMLISGRRGVTSREKLDLWYGGERELPPPG